VSLAAIQGLNAKVDVEIAELRARVRNRDQEVARLERELAALRMAIEVLMARADATTASGHAR
jgi:hypothetical protein